tara:strand:- start:14 stop:541 length:528 start_codon:yes stop_codon:yes gene_type:complete
MHNIFLYKYYFINTFDTKCLDKQDRNTAIIYRNYNTKVDINFIKKIKNFCKKNKLKFFLSNNIQLAINLDLDGAYLPSFNKDNRHLSYSFKKSFLLIGSAHNRKEIRIKEKQRVKQIFLSSIFKKNKNYLGINKYNLIVKLSKKRFIALGGITKKNKRKLRLTNSDGFAGISYFE